MLSIANIDVVETFRLFKERRMNVTFLVPTSTGLEKSIMDATQEVRDFLVSAGAHNYDEQLQGTEHKIQLPTVLVSNGETVDTKTSLYRPETKKGDPRIWITGLKKHAKAGDLLALGYTHGKLIAINCSSTELPGYLDHNDSKAWALKAQVAASSTFEELLDRLERIAAKGYIKTLRPGDTGVGYTLETLLGIAANSSKKPDYKGIELKASRLRTVKSGQSTVFSQVPNWKISRLKGSKQILDERGQYSAKKERHQLFHEISSRAPNSYRLQLEVDDDYLNQIYVPEEGPPEKDVTWLIDKLKERVAEKHKETAWITALSEGKGKDEEFWYKHVKHTRGVDPNAIPILLESGAITVHYLIKETPSGGAKDQGYLFKTASKNLELLFGSVEEYDLTS
jgi:hypothetical protein